MAFIVHIAPSTVDTHLQRAREKREAAENIINLIQTDSDELIKPDSTGDVMENMPYDSDDIVRSS